MSFLASKSLAMATLRRTCPPRTRIASVRQIHRSRVLSAKKGAEDRESVNAEPAEYAKSGSDAQAAHSDTAFDPNETRPEAEEDGGKEQNSGNLDMSPGNTKASRPPKDEGGAENAPEHKASGGGSPNKGGKGPGSWLG